MDSSVHAPQEASSLVVTSLSGSRQPSLPLAHLYWPHCPFHLGEAIELRKVQASTGSRLQGLPSGLVKCHLYPSHLPPSHRAGEWEVAMRNLCPLSEPLPGISCPEFPSCPSRVPWNVMSPGTQQQSVSLSKQKQMALRPRLPLGPGAARTQPRFWPGLLWAARATAPRGGPGLWYSRPEPQGPHL